MAKLKLNMSVMTALGATVTPSGICFAFAINEYSSQYLDSLNDCGILLYPKKSQHAKPLRLPFLPEHRVGNVFCALLKGVSADEYDYNFYFGETVVTDPYARFIRGNEVWGEAIYKSAYKKRVLRGALENDIFDWGLDGQLHIPYEESVIYQLHIRGFTKHGSSRVSHKGTFLGIAEKTDYFLSLGINCLEIMPLYEFEETDIINEQMNPLTFSNGDTPALENSGQKRLRLNYWGFKTGYYFSPKYSYSDGEPVTELKTLVKHLHENGIEMIMQMYFPAGFKVVTIIEILRFWVTNYHIDGFRLLGTDIPVWLLAQEPVLGNSKIIYDYIDEYAVYGKNLMPPFKNLAITNHEFMNSARQFLKADYASLGRFISANSNYFERINNISYISDFNTMTAFDCVSYQEKHNEENGEDNKDGAEENYTWNCGQEGTTHSKKIMELRRRQFKNLMLMLLLGTHTPRIVAGDEFARTQKGNNNPYCQDNAFTWINWNIMQKNKEQFDFVKGLIAFRKDIISNFKYQLRGMDKFEGSKLPEVSYHGENAYIHDISAYKNGIGILRKFGENDYLYIIYNMHWKQAKFCLPVLPAGLTWKLYTETGGGTYPPHPDYMYATGRSASVYVASGARLKPKITKRKKKLADVNPS